jgi:Domain of unknown function (DUF4407)
VALGGVLLSTGGLAVLSASFAVHMALGAWWPVALLIGLGWGVVIVNLDRMLLVGMAHDASWLRNAAMAIPRIGLAVVLGTVISTPLTLQIFAKEIDATMVTMQAEAADEFTTELAADARYAPIPGLQEKVAAEQAVLAGGGSADPSTDSRVKAAQADRDAKQAAYEAAQSRSADLDARAQCELDGSCGSGTPGEGDAYNAAAAAAAQQAAVRDAAKADLDAADADLKQAQSSAEQDAEVADQRSVAQAQAGLVTDQADLDRLTAARNAEQAAFEAQNQQSTGILARLEAMSRLSDARPLLGTAHLMLFLLFLSVEVLPVLTKVLLNFAEPVAYDTLLKVRDDEEVEAEQIRVDGRRRAQQARADLVVAAETDRMAREILDREIAAREEAERREARRQARRGRFARVLRNVVGADRPVPAATEVAEPTLDTGELEALMTAPSAVRPWPLPAPRPAAELFTPVETRDR